MSAPATVDLRGFNRQLARLAALSGKPANEIAKEEAMRFCRQLIKFTPPAVNKATAAGLKASNPGFKNATVKRIASRAILADLRKAVTPISLDPKHPMLKAAIEKNDLKLLQKFLDLPAGKVFGHTAVGNIPAAHRSARNRRGRVPRATGLVSMDTKQWQRHYKAMQARIGYMKSGWLKSWNALRSTKGWRAAPKMISRHAGYAKGSGSVILRRHGIEIQMRNSTKGIGVLANAVNGAVSVRTKTMARRVKYLIKHGARGR